MLTILYFAKLKEDLACDKEVLEYDPKRQTIADLKAELSQRSNKWEAALTHCLCAVNQTMAQDAQVIQAGDEIAFFPRVTGG